MNNAIHDASTREHARRNATVARLQSTQQPQQTPIVATQNRIRRLQQQLNSVTFALSQAQNSRPSRNNLGINELLDAQQDIRNNLADESQHLQNLLANSGRGKKSRKRKSRGKSRGKRRQLRKTRFR